MEQPNRIFSENDSANLIDSEVRIFLLFKLHERRVSFF